VLVTVLFVANGGWSVVVTIWVAVSLPAAFAVTFPLVRHRVVADRSGLVVRDGLRTRRIGWDQISTFSICRRYADNASLEEDLDEWDAIEVALLAGSSVFIGGSAESFSAVEARSYAEDLRLMLAAAKSRGESGGEPRLPPPSP